jgi:dihydroneopterin aldolase
MPPLAVVKIGGSLFDWPDLPSFLRRLTADRDEPTILVAGGGPAVDLLRAWSRDGSLDDEFCHDWSLRIMTTNAEALARLTGVGAVFAEPVFVPHHVVWLDALTFAARVPAVELPENWSVSSDSIAAVAARRFGAASLTLLKSVDLPGGATADDAARNGLVDEWFPNATRSYSGEVRWWNARLRGSPMRWDVRGVATK